ncbi:MAG: glycosyltransferase family 4 protein [Desulfurococcaceae archaeon]
MFRVVQLGTDKLPCPPPKGGAIERYIYGVSRELAKNGIEVHIISLPGWEKSPMFKRIDNVIHHPVNLGYYKTIPYHPLLELNFSKIFGKKISKIIEKIEKDYGKIDFISSHFPTTSFGPLYFKRNNTEVVILHHIHNTFGRKRISNLLMRIYLKYVLRRYDLVCGVSKFVKDWLINDLGLPQHRVTVLYNAIDCNIFKPFPMEYRERLRKLYGLEDYFILLFVGRITPDKGLDHAIKALILLKKEGFNKIRLLVVGPKGQFYKTHENYYNNILRLITMYNLDNMVKYLGYFSISDLPSLYCISDVVLLPSLSEEACPSVLLESLACGRPVIAYDSGGVKELLPSGGGLIVTKGDVRALAKAIKTYLLGNVKVDPNKISTYAISNFSYCSIAKCLIKLYKILKEEYTKVKR